MLHQTLVYSVTKKRCSNTTPRWRIVEEQSVHSSLMNINLSMTRLSMWVHTAVGYQCFTLLIRY